MKLSRIEIFNFGPIGPMGSKIKIDNIVVLIGPNNVGKSTVLDAYEAFVSMGQGQPKVRFHKGDKIVPIEIVGEFSDLSKDDEDIIGKDWKYRDADDIEKVRVRWIWEQPEQTGVKQSWSASKNEWVPGGVGGWDSLFVSRIPIPLRIKATDSHEKLEESVVGILTEAIKASVKGNATRVDGIVEQINVLTNQLGAELIGEADKVCRVISAKVANVFPGYSIKLNPGAGKFEAEKIIGMGSHLTVDAEKFRDITLAHQGSGVQRTFLWSAISALAEEGKLKKGKGFLRPDKPRILLIDEPESFLHPPLVRLAREALYELSNVPGWQVMAATHSPVFIDVAKNHTTIVSLRNDGSTKVFSVTEGTFTKIERTNLQMIRNCHPTVNEFFFAQRAILVEGETEATVINHLFQGAIDRHEIVVINCMGKANLCVFANVLNQFGTPYIVIHDCDSPKAIRKDKPIANAMWKENEKIFQAVQAGVDRGGSAFVISSIPDFERMYFGEEVGSDKPYFAHEKMGSPEYSKEPGFKKMQALKEAIGSGNPKQGTANLEEMITSLKAWLAENNLTDSALWKFENN